MTEFDITTVKDFRNIDICEAMFNQIGNTLDKSWQRTIAKDKEHSFGVVEKNGELTPTDVHEGERREVPKKINEKVYDEMISIAAVDRKEQSESMRLHSLHTHPADAAYQFSIQDYKSMILRTGRSVSVDSSLVLTSLGEKMSIYGYEVEGRYLPSDERERMMDRVDELEIMILEGDIGHERARYEIYKEVTQSFNECHFIV